MSKIISAAARERLIKNGQFLVTNVDDETLGQLAKWIIDSRPTKKEFAIVICSSGGSPTIVVNFASFVGTLGKEVKLTGVAFGECGSAALALLQCCHDRIAVKHCGFFIHHLHSNFNTSPHKVSLNRLKEEIADSLNLEQEIVRMQCTRTGMSVAAWNRLADRGETIKGRAIYPADARKLGLIDKIVDQYTVFQFSPHGAQWAVIFTDGRSFLFVYSFEYRPRRPFADVSCRSHIKITSILNRGAGIELKKLSVYTSSGFPVLPRAQEAFKEYGLKPDIIPV